VTKIKAPFLSLGARGTLGKLLTIRRRRGKHIAESKPIPTDAKSAAQLIWRHMYQKAIDLWHQLSAEEKAEWESLARPRHMTGYAWFISQALRPNPGIYLPLQGGTMQGDILMASRKILGLPTPTADQEAATKKYVDDSVYTLPENIKTLTITFIIDGGGSVITTGQKGHLEIPFACTINQVTMLADQPGSIVVDIWKEIYTYFPPTDADSITASAPPTISSAQKSKDSTLTGWTTAIDAGDILAFNVDSCTTITRVTISLKVVKT